jgi:hypothetical protein
MKLLQLWGEHRHVMHVRTTQPTCFKIEHDRQFTYNTEERSHNRCCRGKALKVKFTLEQATKAQRENWGIALLFL